MIKAIRLLPIAIAATLSLSACGKHDDGTANAVAGEESLNEEVVPAGELGDANATAADSNFSDANVAIPADDVLANNSATLGNGF